MSVIAPAAEKLKALSAIVRCCVRHPRASLSVLRGLPAEVEGVLMASKYAAADGPEAAASDAGAPNPLRAYFDSHTEGPGILKWMHYFDVYHRHLSKFVGREVHVLEIGIFSGGSLGMWRDYFGPGCRVYGVDIQEECRAYESEDVRVFIGDQADRGFWRTVRDAVPRIDVVVDDGGHLPEQQIVTLEEILPHMRPGGVYICEDVHWLYHDFAYYTHGFAHKLNEFHPTKLSEDRLVVTPTPVQRSVGSIHQYPFITVIERTDGPVEQFVSQRHGTEWQPFLP